MTFVSLPYEPRVIAATEARLEQIYQTAKLGLKGDALAFALDMTPAEYRALVSRDQMALYAEERGRAEAEAEMAGVLRTAALAGDTKAALDILKHVHKWTAPQAVQIQVDQKISITHALEQAKSRIIEGYVLDNSEAVDAGTSNGLLDNRNEDGRHERTYASNPEKSTDI